MKILFSDNTLGGLLNFRAGVIRRFVERGDQVVLVAPADEGIDLRDIEALGVRFVPVVLARTGTNPLQDMAYFTALRRIYDTQRPDYIFHYTIKPNIYGTLAARSLGIRSSAMVAGLGHVYSEGSGLGGMVARTMYKIALRYAEHVFVLNRSNRDTLLEGRAVEPQKLILLEGGEGLDLGRFVPLPYPDNRLPVFLMIARLLYQKGYGEYVAAAERLRGRAEFWILGPVDSHPAAVRRETIQADHARGVIRYLGVSLDVGAEIVRADCIVLPSYHEGLSRVLMEGAASARPLVATDIPGCREAVREGVSGFLCRPQDADSLTEALARVVDLSREQREAMGLQGRRLAEELFDQEAVIGRYLDTAASV